MGMRQKVELWGQVVLSPFALFLSAQRRKPNPHSLYKNRFLRHLQNLPLKTKMKFTMLAAFVATFLPRAVYTAPIAAPMADPGLAIPVHDSYAGAAARDEVSTAGRSGYNSVDIVTRNDPSGFSTDGRSGYNSVEIVGRNSATNADTAGRSGYNSVGFVERKVTTNAETNGRSGYN
ncbi:hypothetical protein KVR01_009978 [Diaporthe batatas]|uniref:uncharacterized protein n=1 Tax=Diaporthe batatas TaxID=748121 RepID=UPI001D03CD8C|nr:uncharacterized protein KVR01_009978 [Diaporthe batatas]KAG8160442.1 hypothetical protein KVR01_009978 [Diaporthe batatas]